MSVTFFHAGDLPHWNSLSVGSGEFSLNCFYITTLASDERTLVSILSRLGSKSSRHRSATRPDVCEFLIQLSNEIANDLVGQFAVVVLSSSSGVIVTDLVRTFPVFYAKAPGEKTTWLVSNSARTLLKTLNEYTGRLTSHPDFDTFALQDFVRAGYVSGSDTLVPAIKQAEAGSITLLTAEGDAVTMYHFSYASEEKAHVPDISVERCLDLLVSNVCDFAPSFRSRTVVIPLSGGYDSRFLTTVFSKVCQLDVVAFSYGTPNSPEVETSRAVASALGVPWLFVEYDRALFEEVVRTGLFDEYLAFAHNFSSLPHIQDFFAVYKLKRERLVPDDAVFIPGHTGDFYSGAHILPGVDLVRTSNLERERRALAELIYLYHFYLDGHFRKSRTLRRIYAELSQLHGTPWSVVEDWDRRNRQAKYIVNSLRVYEFFGFSHAIPLWHRRIAEFFKAVPREFKEVYTEEGLQRNLYIRAVRSLFEKFGVDFQRDFSKRFRRYKAHVKSYTGWRRAVTAFKNLVKEFAPNSLQRAVLCALRDPKRLDTTHLHCFDELSRVLGLERLYGCFGIQRVVVERTLDVLKRGS